MLHDKTFHNLLFEYEFSFPWENPPHGEQVRCADFSTTCQMLSSFITDHIAFQVFRSVLMGMHEVGPTQISRMNDHEVIDLLAKLLVQGRIQLYRRQQSFGTFQERKTVAVTNEPRPELLKASAENWIKVAAMDNRNGDASVVNSTVQFPKEVNKTCDTIPTPAPSGIIGDCNYYQWRLSNFDSRHVNCGHKPPDYYNDYGYKYCILFRDDLRSELSENGKIWLDKAKVLLQVTMERGLQQKPYIELDNDKFREFAFQTHSAAYIKAGLHDLSIKDKALIGYEGVKDEWKRRDTWIQVGEVAVDEIFTYFEDLLNLLPIPAY